MGVDETGVGEMAPIHEHTHGYRCDHQVYLLAVQFVCSGATAKSVHQSVSLGQAKKAKVEPKSLSPRCRYA